MRKSIGEILNSKRRELGFSQSELAAALAKDGIDVTNQAISNGRPAARCRAQSSFSRCAALWR